MENKYIHIQRGATSDALAALAKAKAEPDWMAGFRLSSLKSFLSLSMPKINNIDFSGINFDDLATYVQPLREKTDNWEDLPEEIKSAYEKLHVPEWERKYLAGVSAQYESMVVYEKAKEELTAKGVVFMDMDSAVKKNLPVLRRYFGQIFPPGENKFTALNSAFWSGGVFIHIPKGVKIGTPLQSYFFMNFQNFGQFERTLIVADEDSELSYLEGCSAPIRHRASLHAGLVEIVVGKNARVKYTTVQNWSRNVINISMKRAVVTEGGRMEWAMATFGSKATVSYPTTILKGEGAKMSYMGLALAGQGQVFDSGCRAIHAAGGTSSDILSKNISSSGGKNIFHGKVQIPRSSANCTSLVRCQSLIADDNSSALSYPDLEVENATAKVGHEATFGGLSPEQLFYLRSRGLTEDRAASLIINGFVSPVVKDLPVDYAVELKRLIEMEIEGG